MLAADVAGYTRLMELDEANTHGRLMKLRDTVILPSIALHHGKLVKNTGDGFLAMFDSPRAAADCAVSIQRAVIDREQHVTADRRIRFRMGLNVCEVIVEDHDIYGDGVNIAARLHGFAEPGDIVISAAVADLIGPTDGIATTDLGLQALRNMHQAVHVIALHLPDDSPKAGEALPGYDARPSIAVLPFRSTTEDTYFGDGIVDNIIHALAALKELFVISRGSTLAFRGASPDLAAIGRELGVRYIMHGSVQRNLDRLRINTELYDTEAKEVVRTHRQDGSNQDLFDFQDRVAIDVAKAIAPHVRERELKRASRKRPQDMTAYDLVLQAFVPMYGLDYASFSRARGLLQRAITIDPSYAPAYSYAAYWHMFRVGQEWSPHVGADIAEANRLAAIAIANDPQDATGLTFYGYVQAFLNKNHAIARDYIDRAIASQPNSHLAWIFKAATLTFLGEPAQAIECAETGVRLSPLDQHVFVAEHILGQAHYVNGDFENAIHWARKSDIGNRHLTSNLRILISALVATGQIEKTTDLVRLHLRLSPDFSLQSWSKRTPLQGRVLDETVERLRRAGLPH